MDKLNIKFNNPIMDQENIEKIANKVNDIIDTVDEVVDSNGDLEAGKLNRKLYYHPIYFYTRDENNQNLLLGCIAILDNNSTPYTEAGLKTKLENLMDNGALINFNGVVRASSEDTFSGGIMLYKSGDNYVCLNANIINITIDLSKIRSVTDGVNEIYPNVEE